MQIILASTSKYRRKQLKDFGVKFKAIAPAFDEESVKGSGLSPRRLCRELARRKALSLARRYPDAVIIGSDQLVSFQGQILGKPKTFARAVRMLGQMQGKSHELVTSVAVFCGGQIFERQIVARITLRKLSLSEIKAYLHADQPLDCAGSYKFEKGGLSLVAKMACPDPSSLIGLPLIALSQILRQVEVATRKARRWK